MTRAVARTKKNLASDLTWQLPPTKINGGLGRITKPEYLVKNRDPAQTINSKARDLLEPSRGGNAAVTDQDDE